MKFKERDYGFYKCYSIRINKILFLHWHTGWHIGTHELFPEVRLRSFKILGVNIPFLKTYGY